MLFIFLIFPYFPYNPFACGGSISAIWPTKLIRNLCSPLCTPCAASPQMGWRFPQPLGLHLGSFQGPAFTANVAAAFVSCFLFQVTVFTPQCTSPLPSRTSYLFNLEGMLWLPFSLVLLLLAGCHSFCLYLYISLRKLLMIFFFPYVCMVMLSLALAFPSLWRRTFLLSWHFCPFLSSLHPLSLLWRS